MLLLSGSVSQGHSAAAGRALFKPKRKDVLLKPAHLHALVIQCCNRCSLICPAARCKLSGPLQHVSKEITASPREKVPFTQHYLVHSLSQAGPQQLLCFLLHLPLKFPIFMNWEIFLSRLFATSFVSFFPFPCHRLPYKIQTCIAKLLFPKQEVQLSKHLFQVLTARCQRDGVVVSNSQKNK